MRYDFNQKVLYNAYREKYISNDEDLIESQGYRIENNHPYIDI